MMVEKLACVVLFSEILCSPLKFVAALLCNHTVLFPRRTTTTTITVRNDKKKEKKLSKNKAVL